MFYELKKNQHRCSKSSICIYYWFI